MRNTFQTPLNCNILAIKSAFNSLNSGLVLFTDKGNLIDFSLKSCQGVSSIFMSGQSTPNDTSFGRETSRLIAQRGKQGEVSLNSKVSLVKTPSLTNMISSIEISRFIDSGGKTQLCFIDDTKMTVDLSDLVY